MSAAAEDAAAVAMHADLAARADRVIVGLMNEDEWAREELLEWLGDGDWWNAED